MPKYFLPIVFTSLCLILAHSAAHAQYSHADPLTVGVYVSEPFVMLTDNNTFHGMAVELWKTVSEPLGISSKYVQYYSLKEMLDAASCNEVDIILTNLTVTYDRASRLAISYPWFDAGIRVMVNKEHGNTVFKELLNSGRIRTYLWLAALMIALTVLITLVRRRIDAGFTKEWKKGLAQSFHGLVRATKSGEMPPRYFGWIGYILSGIWMVVGVAVMAYVTSTVTTAMTAVSLHPRINSLHDLPGRAIGVVSGSVTDDFLYSLGMTTKGYGSVSAAINDLHIRKLDAVVAPAPVLEYWAYSRPDLDLVVVGNLFHPEKYAFAANEAHRELMDAISLAIIKMHDSDELKVLKNRYFGRQGL